MASPKTAPAAPSDRQDGPSPSSPRTRAQRSAQHQTRGIRPIPADRDRIASSRRTWSRANGEAASHRPDGSKEAPASAWSRAAAPYGPVQSTRSPGIDGSPPARDGQHHPPQQDQVYREIPDAPRPDNTNQPGDGGI